MVVMHDIMATLPDGNFPPSTTFDHALRSKYVEQEEFDNKFKLPKDKTISTEIAYVGFGKLISIQKQLSLLPSLDLSGQCIESAGNLKELKGSLNRVRDLNLANNSLTWHELNQLLSCFPNLKELNITKNRLKLDSMKLCLNLPARPSKSLHFLGLGKIDMDWTSTIRVLSQVWNHIEQIDLWDNKLTIETMRLKDFSPEIKSFIEHIRVLKLSHNYITDWSWINDVGPIENLIELDLSNCHLSSIELNTEHVVSKQLCNLQILNISYNDIGDWKSISNLNQLQNLRSITCHENPIFISEKFAKSFTIGRLGRIRMINREEITRTERIDSEILYLRKVFPEYQSFTKGECDEFKSLHPRFEELANYYGLPEDLTRKHLVDNYITVDLCFKEKKITKKLSCELKIADVKMLCKRLFKLKPSSLIQITCSDSAPSNDNMSYILDKNGQTLHFFSVGNGQKLIIEDLS